MGLLELEPKKEIVPDGYKIKANGIFDFEELYQEMQRWFIHTGYSWKETRYLVSDQGQNRLSEISWLCIKKIDEYMTYKFEAYIKVNVSEVEVTIENAKKKTNKGSIEFRFRGDMEKNVAIWNKKFMGHFLGLIYEKVLIRNRLGDNEDKLKAESQRFFNEIKSYLQIR